MANTIQIKRGNSAPPAGTLLDGELGFDKANDQLYIGNGTEQISLIPKSAADVGAVPTSRTVNGKALSSNITLSASDVGARASTWVPSASDITSGTLSSDRLPTVPVTKGGTGATTAAGALTNLGITATAAELNKLDGVTATTAELNYVDGVTSNIQTQLNAKVPTSRTVNGKALSSNISLTAADVGAMATRPNVQVTLSTPGWYRIGSVNFYGCYRLTVSPRYSNTQDMGVVLDIVATESNPVINKTAVGHRSSSVRQIDKVRLVKGSTGYAVDIHYNVSVANAVYVRLDGPDGMWVTYAEWSTASDSATAAATCVITPYKTLTSAEYGTSLPAAGNAGRIFFKKVT